MGFLTTFTVYNDSVHDIVKQPKILAENIYSACCGEKHDESHCDHIVYQKPRHSSDKTIYVHAGNTVCEINQYSDTTKTFNI